MFTLPADGMYQVRVGDTQQRGGETFGYRLRISAPQPDFELRVVPSSINALAGTNVPLTVYAMRQDGLDGPIDLKLVDMPEGFALSGGVIQAGQENVQLTMAVPGKPQANPIPLNMQGQALIGGEQIHRTAVAADDQMQAFLYRHLVPRQQGVVMIGGKARRPQNIRFTSQLPVSLSIGGTAQLQLVIPKWLATQLTLELNDPPKGLEIKQVTPNDEGLLIELTAEGEEIKSGLRGNLIIEGFQVRRWKAKDGKNRSRRVSVGYLPAAPFEIAAAPLVTRSALNE